MFGGVPRKYFFHSTAMNKQVEEELMDLLERRKIKVEIEKVYPMEDALEVKLSTNVPSSRSPC